MRTANQWFDAYSGDHRDHTNQIIHWICVPVILWCALAMLWTIPTPLAIEGFWALLAMAATLGFYARLSYRLGLAMLIWLVLNAWLVSTVLHAAGLHGLWVLALSLFVLAWIGQFVGHLIEGRRPSFFTDLAYLLIGPAWLMGKLTRRLGWPVV